VCACKGRDRRTSEPALPCLEQQGQAPMPASGSCCVYPHFFWARRGRPLGPALGPPLGRVASFFALVTRARHCGRAQAATSTTSGAPGMHFREGCAVAAHAGEGHHCPTVLAGLRSDRLFEGRSRSGRPGGGAPRRGAAPLGRRCTPGIVLVPAFYSPTPRGAVRTQAGQAPHSRRQLAP